MKSRLNKSKVRTLALAIGLPAALLALLLARTAETAPSLAAAPARSELLPAWTSTEPVTTVITPDDLPRVWTIDPYDVTITFWDGVLQDPAEFTFTPRPDLELDPPVVSTPYIFELRGYFINTGGSVSLWGDIEYNLQYDESQLNGVSEHTLEVYRLSDKWSPQDAAVNTTANRITWETNFTGKYGVGGLAPRMYIYLPTTFNTSSVRFNQAGSQPVE